MSRPLTSASTPRFQISRSRGLVSSLADRLLEWQERARSRVLLGRLDDRMLRDMGLTRSDVDVESSKPFWRA
jgi:uncharacterized protein YjiS (DUF1127 family)